MSSEIINTKTKILNATWKLMVAGRGQNISMGDIAKAAGISRQALYLHFSSRIELVIATVEYVDVVKGIGLQLETYHQAVSGAVKLALFVEIWGAHIPKIYGLAQVLLATKETDTATAAAWQDRMGQLMKICTEIIVTLENEGKLSMKLSTKVAAQLLWSMTSIESWAQLTQDCKWSNKTYIKHMKTLTNHTFVI